MWMKSVSNRLLQKVRVAVRYQRVSGDDKQHFKSAVDEEGAEQS